MELDSNTYKITRDATFGSDFKYSSSYLSILRDFLHNLPLNKNYVAACSIYGDIYVVVFDNRVNVSFIDDYCVFSGSYWNGSNWVPYPDDWIEFYIFEMNFDFDSENFGVPVYMYLRPLDLPGELDAVQFSPDFFEISYLKESITGNATIEHLTSLSWQTFSPFSNVGSFFVDISDRKGLVYQYATVFSLAVFLILGILRGFWRSARGRDT